MKKKEFEELANSFEEKVESVAKKIDISVTKKAESKLGKIIIKIINLIMIVLFLVGGIFLLKYGHLAWAIVCLILAGLSIIWQILEVIIFKD